MSGSPAGAKPEKTMSSRLLTMKFMQRAAATAAAKEPSHPPSTEANELPTPKRPRLSTDAQSPNPATPRSSDLEAISAALAAEEEKRREALARQAAEAGETEWVLEWAEPPETTSGQYAPQPFVVAAESLDAEDDDMVSGGRKSFGNFKRKNKETRNADENDSESDDEDDDVDMDDPASIEAMINKAKAKAKASKKEKKKTQSQPVRLSKLTSISGGRQATIGGNKSQKKRKSR